MSFLQRRLVTGARGLIASQELCTRRGSAGCVLQVRDYSTRREPYGGRDMRGRGQPAEQNHDSGGRDMRGRGQPAEQNFDYGGRDMRGRGQPAEQNFDYGGRDMRGRGQPAEQNFDYGGRDMRGRGQAGERRERRMDSRGDQNYRGRPQRQNQRPNQRPQRRHNRQQQHDYQPDLQIEISRPTISPPEIEQPVIDPPEIVTEVTANITEPILPVNRTKVEEEFSSPAPGSHVDPDAVEDEEKIYKLVAEGNWKDASKALKKIKKKGLKPSIKAYVAVTSALRRVLRGDDAEKCYRQMLSDHMPENIFKEYATDDPFDTSKRRCQQGLNLVVTMTEEDKLAAEEDTYRSLLSLCNVDFCWHLAILLAEHAHANGIKLNKYSMDMLCQTVENSGYTEIATMLFENLVLDNMKKGNVEADFEFTLTDDEWPVNQDRLDLHNLTISAAVCAVRTALLDVARMPATRAYVKRGVPLKIIVGKGNNSKDGEAKIKPEVIRMTQEMDLKPRFEGSNDGCIIIDASVVQSYVDRIQEGGQV